MNDSDASADDGRGGGIRTRDLLLPKQPSNWKRHYCEPCRKWFSMLGLQIHKCVEDEAKLPSTSTQDRPDSARDEGDFDGK